MFIDNFPGANFEFGAPAGWEDKCQCLTVMLGLDPKIEEVTSTSCYQLDVEQLQQLQKNGGKLYLTIVGGQQPPVRMSCIHPALEGIVPLTEGQVKKYIDYLINQST